MNHSKTLFHFQMSNTLLCLKSEISNSQEMKKYVVNSQEIPINNCLFDLHTQMGIKNRFQKVLVWSKPLLLAIFWTIQFLERTFWPINFYVKSGSPKYERNLPSWQNCSYFATWKFKGAEVGKFVVPNSNWNMPCEYSKTPGKVGETVIMENFLFCNMKIHKVRK